MANQTGRPIAPARKLVAAVMGTIAVFVMALGLGMSSWGVVIFGLAVLALSIALGMVNVVRRGARAWVAGTAEVKAVSPPPTSSSVYGRAEIQAVVVAPGLPTSEVTLREPRVPVVKWPVPGDTLPITVDVDDMRRVRINWDEAAPRERGEDPPPPTREYDEADYDDDLGDLDNDLLGDVEPPPWAARDRQWQDDGPPPPPPAASYEETQVVIRDTPAGPVVEGELVNHDTEPPPLPRRAAPGAAGATAAAAAAGAAGAAGAGAAGGTAGAGAGAAGGAGTAGTTAGTTGGAGTTAGTTGGAGTAGTAGGAGASAPPPPPPPASGRPAGARPSPRPRGGGTATATAEPGTYTAQTATGEPSTHTAQTATAEPGTYTAQTATAVDPEAMADQAAAAPPPPSQRTPHPDDALPFDVPLDDPTFTDEAADSQPDPTQTAGAQTAAGQTAAAQTADEAPPRRRPEPTATWTTATPSPMTSFPTAPEPVIPRPTAPPPFPSRPSTPEAYDDIDLPLDGDPDPAPETTPAAADALADDLVAPPVEKAPPPARDSTPLARESTRFMSNAAHDAEAGAAAPPPPDEPHARPAGHSGGMMAAAAAAAGAVAAAAVAAVKKVGRSDKDEHATPTQPATHAASAAPATAAAEAAEPPAPVAASEPPAPAAASEPFAPAEPIAAAATPAEPIAAAAAAAGPIASSGAAAPGAGTAPAAGATPTSSDKSDNGPWSDLPATDEHEDHTDDLITAYPSARPGPAGAIYGVGITVLVTDLARSIAFYRDTLGFFEIDSGDGSAVLASGDTRLVLRTVAGLSAEAGRLIYLNLEVGDIEAVYTELGAKGVHFLHGPRPVNRGDRLELWSATFRDPDDHNIAITQWRAIR